MTCFEYVQFTCFEQYPYENDDLNADTAAWYQFYWSFTENVNGHSNLESRVLWEYIHECCTSEYFLLRGLPADKHNWSVPLLSRWSVECTGSDQFQVDWYTYGKITIQSIVYSTAQFKQAWGGCRPSYLLSSQAFWKWVIVLKGCGWDLTPVFNC